MTGGQRNRSASTTSRRLRPESGVAGRAKELNWYPRCNSELVHPARLSGLARGLLAHAHCPVGVSS